MYFWCCQNALQCIHTKYLLVKDVVVKKEHAHMDPNMGLWFQPCITSKPSPSTQPVAKVARVPGGQLDA